MSRKKTGRSQLVVGKQNQVIGEGRFVSFYCRGTTEHPHEKWRIGSVCPDVHNDELFWAENRSGYAETGATYFYGLPPFTRWLDGDRYLKQDMTLGGTADESEIFSYTRDEFRTTWELECRLCRYKSTIRPNAAYPLLNQFSTLGVIEVPLREFTKRVGRANSSH